MNDLLNLVVSVLIQGRFHKFFSLCAALHVSRKCKNAQKIDGHKKKLKINAEIMK